MYVGIDIGGTNTRVALFHSLDNPDFTVLTRFPTLQNYKQQLDTITSALEGANVPELAGIGVAVGARVAKDGRSVAFAPNLPGYVDQPLVQDLGQRWGCVVRMAHDTICGLLSEHKFGVLRAQERCAYLTLSTGTGAAIHLQKGVTALTTSIEFGHQLVAGNTLSCVCGQVGCLETLTGGRQLEIRLGHSIEQVAEYTFWEQLSTPLASGLVNLAQLTRVEIVAISGAIALHKPFLLSLLQQKVNERIRGMALTLQFAQLREDAPLVGAAGQLAVAEESIIN